MRKNIEVGSLVLDERTDKTGVVIATDVTWVDTDGQTHMWDYEIMYENGTHFADADEIKVVINESR